MEEISFMRFGLAFLFVLGLIGMMAYVLRRFGGKQKWLNVQDEKSRLRIVETRLLDHKRRLVLVKRDDREHLILLGDGRETLIETGIKADSHA